MNSQGFVDVAAGPQDISGTVKRRVQKRGGTNMTIEQHYERKVSSEEADEGYLFIMKDSLSFFPAVRKPFVLCTREAKRSVRVESYRCICRGPALPHEHYFIRWEGLRRGEKIAITRMKANARLYRLVSKK